MTVLLICVYIYISADPGLRQGRGGAWDHRRCGTCFVTAMALTLSKVVPATIACLCLSGLPSFKGLKRAAAAPTTQPSRRPFPGNSRSHTPQPSVFKSVQACRLPALKPSKPSKPSRRPFHGNSRSYTPQASVSLGRSSLPFARSQTLQTLPQAFPRQLSQPHPPAICF